MLFDKSNQQILQDLDDRGPAANRKTKVTSNLTFRNTRNTKGRNQEDSLKSISKKYEETQREICKIRKEKNVLVLKLQTNEEKVKKLEEEKDSHYKRWLQTKISLDSFQKEIKVLEHKLSGIDHWKTLAKNANKKDMESQHKIQDLEKSLAKEKMIVRIMQEYIIKHFYREQSSPRSSSEHYDLLKMHTTQQKLLQKKTDELSKKELELIEKDKMLKTLKNSKVRIANSEHLNQSIETRNSIKEKETRIKALIAQINMCESAIAGYKNEVNGLKQLLGEKKHVMKQR